MAPPDGEQVCAWGWRGTIILDCVWTPPKSRFVTLCSKGYFINRPYREQFLADSNLDLCFAPVAMLGSNQGANGKKRPDCLGLGVFLATKCESQWVRAVPLCGPASFYVPMRNRACKHYQRLNRSNGVSYASVGATWMMVFSYVAPTRMAVVYW